MTDHIQNRWTHDEALQLVCCVAVDEYCVGRGCMAWQYEPDRLLGHCTRLSDGRVANELHAVANELHGVIVELKLMRQELAEHSP